MGGPDRTQVEGKYEGPALEPRERSKRDIDYNTANSIYWGAWPPRQK